jgi:hypothetical protein
MPKENSNIETNYQSDGEESDEEFNYFETTDKFDTKRLRFGPSKSSSGQQVCHPKYLYGEDKFTKDDLKNANDPIYIKTGPIKNTRGGIPPYNDKYHKQGNNSNERAFTYIPMDEDQEECKNLRSLLQTIDDYMFKQIDRTQKKNEKKVLTFINSDNKEVPIDCDEVSYKRMITKSKKNKEKPEIKQYERIKAKFNVKYDENIEAYDRELKTVLYLDESDDPIELKHITDFEKYVKWNGVYEYLLQISKAWAGSVGGSECVGLTIKIIQMNVVELPSSNSSSKQIKSKIFGRKKTAKKAIVEEEEESDKSDDEEEGDGEDGSDDSDDSDDSDEEDDGEDDSDDGEEDDDEEEEKTKSSKKPSKKSNRKNK